MMNAMTTYRRCGRSVCVSAALYLHSTTLPQSPACQAHTWRAVGKVVSTALPYVETAWGRSGAGNKATLVWDGSTYSPEWRRSAFAISVLHMERENDGFVDRTQAGRALGRIVRELKLQPPVLVLALPRGGVPIAYEVANALHAPLDVLVVRKIGMPGQPELAIGAIASGGILVREPGGGGQDWLDAHFGRLAQRELAEVERRERAYRGGLPPLDLRGRTVVLVDDGLATGATMVAAIRAARQAGAHHVVVAAPVASDASRSAGPSGGRPGRDRADAKIPVRDWRVVRRLRSGRRRRRPASSGVEAHSRMHCAPAKGAA